MYELNGEDQGPWPPTASSECVYHSDRGATTRPHPNPPYRVFVTKMANRNNSNTFTFNQSPNLMKHFVHMFHDYCVDLYISSMCIDAQGLVSAPL